MNNWRELDSEYENEKQRYPHPVPSRSFIIETLRAQPKALSFSGLAKLFGLNRAERETLNHRVKAMLRSGEIEYSGKTRLRAPKLAESLPGVVFAHPEGFGFFIPDDKTKTNGEDFFLHYSEMRNLMHGDRVEARVVSGGRKDKLEGKVTAILERATTTVVGRVVNNKGGRVVQAENRRMTHAIIPINLAESGAELGQVVEVAITVYPKNGRPLKGEITRVLGAKMDSGMEIDIAIANYDLPHEWPAEVEAQSQAIPDTVQATDYTDRVDVRNLPLVTIDGITARDFDDAVFAKKTNTGYKLYVAIADVAHYVTKDSPLDGEALKRATSVYFPNRVIPMLPEKLSNGLCSLNPDVDRLCMVCEMVISESGEITRSRFYNAVMHSHARLTYDMIEESLFKESSPLPEQHTALLPHLRVLKQLYEVLRAQRDQRGAIDFHTVEPEFEYDSEGNIARITGRKSLKSYQLIEEFMVRANVCAANFLLKQTGSNKAVALFRNHQGPSESKYDKLVQSLAQEGITLPKADETITPQQLAELVQRLKGHENFEAIQLLILRSMHQAVYEADNEGHFGLALEHYAHFTSPIRRYPDLLVHRAIKHGIAKEKVPYVYSAEQMQSLGEQCSMAERRADEAVYDVIGFLKCEFMQDKLGQRYAATISGVTNFGFFAVLDDMFIDGLVHISSLNGDYFNFDEQKRILLGESSRHVYKMGDRVEVIVSSVSLDERRIDFVLVDEYLPYGGNTQQNKGKHKQRPTKKRVRKKKK